jgi:hypothetical protein
MKQETSVFSPTKRYKAQRFDKVCSSVEKNQDATNLHVISLAVETLYDGS